ncbi:hypothetical protein FRC06_007639, partial [Ceratobasidium sp. 370]
MPDHENADPKVHTTHEKPVSIWRDMVANRRAYWMAASACWGGMLFGWDTGLIGGILPRTSFKHSFGLDKNPGAYADLQGFGRKPALFVAAFFFFLGSILQTVAALGKQSATSSLNQLYVGRAIGGYGVGIVSVVVPTYISESAPRLIRGRLTGMYQLAIVFGIAFSFWVNYGLLEQYGDSNDVPQQWRTAFGLQLLPGFLLVVSMLTQRESPRWLAEKGRDEECKTVLAKLRGVPISDPIVQEEHALIRADFEGRVKLTIFEQFREATSSKKMFYRCSLPFIL